MSNKVNVNEAKVLELWSKGYNDKQVRMYLGLSVSTWDRWKKGECYFVNVYGSSQYYNSSGLNDLFEALGYFDF